MPQKKWRKIKDNVAYSFVILFYFIFWYPIVLNRTFFCYLEHLTVRSTLGRYLLDMDGAYSKLSVTVLVWHLTWAFVYLSVYLSTHICPSHFKDIFWIYIYICVCVCVCVYVCVCVCACVCVCVCLIYIIIYMPFLHHHLHDLSSSSSSSTRLINIIIIYIPY